jgi:protocatechuate 3,4-dioxygenase beta subunit
MIMRVISPLCVLALLAGQAGPVLGQAVRGVLVERGNGRPVRGAFVVLLDEREAEVARVLTDDAGRFLLRAPSAGAYRIQSKRIGFRLFLSEPLALEPDQTVAYRAEVAAVPAMLPPVVVEGRPQCGSRGEVGSVTARLWEEAREALAAVTWTSGEGRHRYQLRNFLRDYGPVGRLVLKDSSWMVSGYAEAPFLSLPAHRLADSGYVVTGGADTIDYYAPDATVLLSDVFLNTHCFTATDGTGENAGLVGLAFEPAPGRHLPDVEGTLWFDRSSAELRNLEFTYTRLPAGLPEGALGGSVTFMRLTGGGWIVREWSIRMARMGRVVYRDTGRPAEGRVLGFRERGGQVSTITTPRGAVAYSAEEAIVEGTVYDSTRRAPLAGALVFLDASQDSTRTDARGAFSFAVPLAGTYAVLFHHRRLDSLGFRPPSVSAVLRPGDRTVLELVIPREDRIVTSLCQARPLAEEERALIGVVRDAAGNPVNDALVEAEWQVVGGARAQLTVRHDALETTADSAGRYVLCGVPLGPVRITAHDVSSSRSATALIRFVEQGVWINDQRYRSWPGRIWTQDFEIPR